MSDNPLIHAKMASILKASSHIGKDQQNRQQGFRYRGIDDVYNALHGLFGEHGVYCTSEILEKSRTERPTKQGGILAFTILRMKYTFWAEDGSSTSTVVEGEGMDSGDKSSNKAMAVAHKYALLQAFMIPTDEQKDPDPETHELGVEFLSAEQVANLQSLIEETGANESAFLKYMQAQSLERIQPSAYSRAVAALEHKRKKS